jgi:hypothetical protein
MPGIYALLCCIDGKKGVDRRDKPGHDEKINL